MTKRNSKSKIFFKLIILILAVYFLYFIGSIFYKRNFIKNDTPLTEEKTEKVELEKLKNRPPINTKITLPEENQETDDSENNLVNNEFERKNQFEVSRSNCDNECKNYTEINELDYCKQVCGLISIKKSEDENSETSNSDENCEKPSGLQKDYCWRDQAITETNFEKCKKIKDNNIYKQCKNRITEDIVDNQF